MYISQVDIMMLPNTLATQVMRWALLETTHDFTSLWETENPVSNVRGVVPILRELAYPILMFH